MHLFSAHPLTPYSNPPEPLYSTTHQPSPLIAFLYPNQHPVNPSMPTTALPCYSSETPPPYLVPPLPYSNFFIPPCKVQFAPSSPLFPNSLFSLPPYLSAPHAHFAVISLLFFRAPILDLDYYNVSSLQFLDNLPSFTHSPPKKDPMISSPTFVVTDGSLD
ncbi:hypothetical protein Pcinc_017489 [Petrolisthes cinctipes]|uniref:Uncharacterized protein n=1 Tax=Petrolisthes cinctipes TaxID=88211 RepID=A0AAE1FP59_PETCI|nr:hypothetical protein Pcinc_017489 [Petrolisthes cinctipes]